MSSNGKKNAEQARESVDVERLWHIWHMNGPDLSLSCEICSLLKESELLYELDIFLRNLPLEEEYLANETLNRARAKVAFWKGDFDSVYSILKNNYFSRTEDLIELWDLCHYKEEENRRQKALTPLMRFRIRQRYMPPMTILPSGRRKKTTLPKESTDILREWFNANQEHPYPTRDTKIILAQQTALTKFQVSTWFANARRRFYRRKIRVESKVPTRTKTKSKRKKNNVNKNTVVSSSMFHCDPENTGAIQVPPTDSSATGVRWSPSNQPTNPYWCYDCGCYAQEAGPSILFHQVHQSLAKPCVPAEDFIIKDEYFPTNRQDSMHREELSPYPLPISRSCPGSTHAITSFDGNHCLALESRGRESTNQDAAQILVDLSSKYYK